MTEYCIQNTNTGMYLQLAKAIFIGWTNNIAEAFHFAKRDAAQNYVENNVSHATNNTVSAKDCIIVDHDRSIIETDMTAEEAEELMNSVDCLLHQMYETGDAIQRLYQYHLSQVQTSDRAICDLLHKIEFSDANVVGGYRMYKAMQELCRRRRAHKNACQFFGSIIQTGLLSKISNTQQIVPKCEESIANKKYAPRINASLFDTGNNKELFAALDDLVDSVSDVGMVERTA